MRRRTERPLMLPSALRQLAKLLRSAIACAAATLCCGLAQGESIEGFTEPHRTLHLAAPEWGIVQRVLVKEGEDVAAGQPLVRLDDDLLQSQLAIAKQQMEATGKLKAAAAELEVFEKRLSKLTQLLAARQASREEVERARADRDAAEGRLLTEREERELLRLQYEKVRVQIGRRTLLAPISGKVAEVLKHEGEGIGPSDPGVVRLVELNPLRVVFLMTRPQAAVLRTGQAVQVVFAVSHEKGDAVIESVSDMTDAESGMVSVKALLPNPVGKYHSGERCVLQLGSGS